MKVTRKHVTHYAWNEHAVRNLMVQDIEDKFGIDILPSMIKRVPVKDHPDILHYVYTVDIKENEEVVS